MPLAFDAASDTAFLCTLATVIRAPVTGAPEESAISPQILARNSWPAAGTIQKIKTEYNLLWLSNAKLPAI